jgi:hypothetical protein
VEEEALNLGVQERGISEEDKRSLGSIGGSEERGEKPGLVKGKGAGWWKWKCDEYSPLQTVSTE